MDTLLLEIGTEEIPAGYIHPALKALAAMLQKKMTEARIEHGSAETFGTPRRLAVRIEKVAAKQLPLKTELTGPPVKVGFDESGKPTMAAKKFAEKAGVKIDQLSVKETRKGDLFMCAQAGEGTGNANLAERNPAKGHIGDPVSENHALGGSGHRFCQTDSFLPGASGLQSNSI